MNENRTNKCIVTFLLLESVWVWLRTENDEMGVTISKLRIRNYETAHADTGVTIWKVRSERYERRVTIWKSLSVSYDL